MSKRIILSLVVMFSIIPLLAFAPRMQNDLSVCTFTKPMGNFTLCVVHEEEAGSFQDILEWNPRTQSMFIFNSDGQVCYWDVLTGNSSETEVLTTQDTSFYLNTHQRWVVMFTRPLFPDEGYLILIPNDNTTNCMVDR